MDMQEILAEVEIVVRYEMFEAEADCMEQGLEWDVEETRDRVFQHLINRPGFVEWLDTVEQWYAEETVHLAALDYFSSYEPVYRRIEAAYV